jgi:hypothetical protein
VHPVSDSVPLDHTAPPSPTDEFPDNTQFEIWPVTLLSAPPRPVLSFKDTLPPVIVTTAFEMPPPPLPPGMVCTFDSIAQPVIESVPPLIPAPDAPPLLPRIAPPVIVTAVPGDA